MKKILTLCFVATLVTSLHPSVCAQNKEASKKAEDKHGTTFTAIVVTNAPIRIKLATPVTKHIDFDSLPAIRYLNTTTNRHDQVLIGTTWIEGTKKEEEKTVQEVKFEFYFPTSAENLGPPPAQISENELWTKPWRSFAGMSLQGRVAGKGTIRIGLFEAIPDGSGHPVGFTYGKQLSNLIDVPIVVAPSSPLFR